MVSLVGVAGFEPAASCSQSRRDNRATLHPEGKILSGETGTRTLATITRRQISNLLHYRSGTSPSSKNVSCFAVANVTHHPNTHNYFRHYFYYFFHFILNPLTIKHIDSNKNKTIFIKIESTHENLNFIQKRVNLLQVYIQTLFKS